MEVGRCDKKREYGVWTNCDHCEYHHWDIKGESLHAEVGYQILLLHIFSLRYTSVSVRHLTVTTDYKTSIPVPQPADWFSQGGLKNFITSLLYPWLTQSRFKQFVLNQDPIINLVMCYYEKIDFRCGHSQYRKIEYCHFARNDPNHQCFGPWNVKRSWKQDKDDCDACNAKK